VARRLVILGSTGSIGVQALDVVSRSAEDELQVVGLSAGSAWEAVIEQARTHGVTRVALADPHAAAQAAEAWTDGEVLSGPDGIVTLITEAGCDLVLNGIVGSAGLVPTVASLGEGIDLALANKESLVVGGELVTQLSEATGAAIIPVDSEHSALHQLLATEQPGTVLKLILTASGGPFRGRKPSELDAVTVEQALAHPTWSMGGTITIDSATLMNKGLEVIEAHHLFGTPMRTSTSSCTRSRSSTASSSSATGPRWPTSATRTCESRSPMGCTTPSASTCRCGRSIWPSWAPSPSSRSTPTASPACAWRARPGSPAAPPPAP
jgi:1-deoxy-D-xylulose-5-phosphate reductoisomerase